MHRRRQSPHVRLVQLPTRAVRRHDSSSLKLAERARSLRATLSPGALPPPVVPVRAEVVDGEQGPRIFLDLRNLSGESLEGAGLEVVTLDESGREVGTMYAALSDLRVSSDPGSDVRVGGWPIEQQRGVCAAVITLLFVRFEDGTSWDGELEALEDPRLPPLERRRRLKVFMDSYGSFLNALDLRVSDASNAN